MSSFDNTAVDIRDLLMLDKPIGATHAQNTDCPSITGTSAVELLAAAGSGYRYELVEFIAVNSTGAVNPIVELVDQDNVVYWRQRVGDPTLGEGQATWTFRPRRLWGHNKKIMARLTASGGTVRVYVSAYKMPINPDTNEVNLPTRRS